MQSSEALDQIDFAKRARSALDNRGVAATLSSDVIQLRPSSSYQSGSCVQGPGREGFALEKLGTGVASKPEAIEDFNDRLQAWNGIDVFIGIFLLSILLELYLLGTVIESVALGMFVAVTAAAVSVRDWCCMRRPALNFGPKTA